MQAVLDEQSVGQVLRRFEQGVLKSTLSSADAQVRHRFQTLPHHGFKFQLAQGTEESQEPTPDAAEVVTALTLYGVDLPEPIRRVSAGCIEAMNYIWDRTHPNHPRPQLDSDTLAYVASQFSSPNRLRGLIDGGKVPEDSDLRDLLRNWGPPFVLCIQAIGSRFPGATPGLRLPQVEAASPGALSQSTESEWSDELNARRCELIDKKVQGLLTDSEGFELEGLQQSLRRHVNRVSPLPFDAAKRLHAELLQKQRAKQ